MDNFFEKYNLPKLIQKELGDPDSPPPIKETFSQRKPETQIFSVFNQTSKEKMILILNRIFRKY